MPANMAAWSIEDVGAWLKTLDYGFDTYARLFVSDHVDGYRLFMCVDRNVLRDRYKITHEGHQTKILDAIHEAKMIHINAYRHFIRY